MIAVTRPGDAVEDAVRLFDVCLQMELPVCSQQSPSRSFSKTANQAPVHVGQGDC